ncbi:MAG TPA: methyl-accepting chemotaxis protein [Bosea sp. (in: a-proteobacteria)]|jgi:methyl-accepting chemotaxis protein|uniref:methyl-accepting chemotaxis protein n=1 Tax=Bosea sp. (in: a-proteobacteria) TaxID=1871050 RepID=UPI002E14D409|nr:methyl-accepting chemotaxis protein [Bosea sp. (in: a-proteobacteria)]
MKKIVTAGLPIATRLAVVGVLFVGLAVAASVLVSLQAAEKAMRERAQASLSVNINLLRDLLATKGEPRLEGDKLFFGNELVNGNFAAVDKVKALAGSTATVFMGDVRVATNVQKPDGSRAVGTKLAPGAAYDAVFKQRATYSGAADILGTPYFTIYEPIIQKSDNSVIGVLYVGIKQQDFMSVISEMITGNIIAGLVIAAVAGVALFLLVRRMMKPLGSLKAAMERLAAGDLASVVPSFRSGEFADMAGAVAVLRNAAIEKERLEVEAASQASLMDETRRSTEEQRQLSAQQRLEQAQQLEKVVGALADGLAELSHGNLTYRIELDLPADYVKLRDDFNATVERLSSTVKTIQATTADVGLAAREINTGADDLSKRTEEQASSLEETAATTEELAASVKATAQASRQAAAVADEAMQAAQSGGLIAGQAVDAMARIEAASTKISDIIRVIDDIAFQTNLLALNAAVEAARAGDAGKGFAVVASEVRTLAQRSSEAAKDISALISSSNGEVGEGVKLVRQAGAQLSQILASSQKVADTIAEISAASGEQASGIDEMSQAVAHLDEMTQANAALAEQSAASAGSLTGRIGQLNDLVAAFRTGSEAGGAVVAHRQPAPAASEPARLRRIAEAAFVQTRAPAATPTPRAPARKVANGHDDTGWEEF